MVALWLTVRLMEAFEQLHRGLGYPLRDLRTRVWAVVAVAGMGIALTAGAALSAMLALLLCLAAVAAAIATVLPVWAALLIPAGASGAFAGVLGLTALQLLRRASPPVPTQAIDEARRTAEALRSNGNA